MKFAFYTSVVTLKDSTPDKNQYVMIFYIWLYYLIKSTNVNKDDSIYVLTDEETAKYIGESIIFNTLKNIFKINNIKFIEVPAPAKYVESLYNKYLPPLLDIFETEKFDYVLYSDVTNLIKKPIKSIFKTEEFPHCFVILEDKLMDDTHSTYIKNTEWYELNKKMLDQFPGINSSLFCVHCGSNEMNILKSVYKNPIDADFNESISSETAFFNYKIYYHSQFLTGDCYMNVDCEALHKVIDVNNITSEKPILSLFGNLSDGARNLEKVFMCMMNDLLNTN
jgi:hypothetical protein